MRELDILKSGFTMEEFNQFVYNNSYKERRNKMIKKENVWQTPVMLKNLHNIYLIFDAL